MTRGAFAALAVLLTACAGTPESAPPTPSHDGATGAEPSAEAEVVWRTEAFHGIELEVPDTWARGDDLELWCGDDDPGGWQDGAVERPHPTVGFVLCAGYRYSYGLRFSEADDVIPVGPVGEIWQYGDDELFPDDAWLATIVRRNAAFTVAAADREVVEHVVGSVRGVPRHGVDTNGCPPIHDWGPQRTSPAGTVSVCQYFDGYWLTRSERLTGADAEAALAAVRAAPRRADQPCPLEKVPSPVIDLVTPRGIATLTWKWCTGINWHDHRRRITSDVLYWAISPGYQGALPYRLPFPDELRE